MPRELLMMKPRTVCFAVMSIVASLLATPALAAGPTFTVNTTEDKVAGDLVGGQTVDCTTAGQPCTLRAAVEQGGVTINLPSGTYALTSFGTPDGVFLFARDAAIVGAGAATTTITNSSGQRLAFIRDHTLSVSGVTIVGTDAGTQRGGAFQLYFGAALVLADSVLTGHTQSAISNDLTGTVTVTRCSFHDNLGFGAIINSSTLNVAGSAFT